MQKTSTASADIPFNAAEVLPPGETLRETLDALHMSQSQLAQRTGLSPKHINQILQGQSALTHETAISLERVTGVPARLWNGLESQYRDHLTRSREHATLVHEQEWLKRMPVAALRKRGLIHSPAKDPGALLQELLQLFGVSTVGAWNDVWAKPAANFLQSAAFEADVGAVSAWLRLGELEASKIRCAPFSRSRLKDSLSELRRLTLVPQQVFEEELTRICAASGVAVVLVREVTGARASGATRWLSPHKAVIQLSDRGKRNDKFWFAFFHEIGHVLLHGKREVFVEHDIGLDGGRLELEAEANSFARELLIPKTHEAELSTLRTELEVSGFASKLGIAPGIVVGRLQRDRKDYRIFNDLFDKFEISS